MNSCEVLRIVEKHSKKSAQAHTEKTERTSGVSCDDGTLTRYSCDLETLQVKPSPAFYKTILAARTWVTLLPGHGQLLGKIVTLSTSHHGRKMVLLDP